MTDVFSSTKRSEVMAAIRGKGNKSTEEALITAMRKAGITGWRRHIAFKLVRPVLKNGAPSAGLRRRVVRPDFTFRRQRLIVFVDGCYWHKCPIHQTKPKQNADFWADKLAGNVARDKATNYALRKKGWSVMRIWEHELATADLVIRHLRRRLLNAARRAKNKKFGKKPDE
jgi:DNA mismatch endonuclease (patch repair protein)